MNSYIKAINAPMKNTRIIKLYNNNDSHINFAKHLWYINSKKIKQNKNNDIYNNHFNQWYF